MKDQLKRWFDRDGLVALAPMEAITDRAWRPVVRKIAPDVVLFTEFANARGLLHGAKSVWEMVEFQELERPLVIQLYDSDPISLGEATREVVRRHRPDGIDLNMGCPVRKVAARGAGCGMMAFPKVAAEAVKRMVDNADGIPVTIKTRLGIREKSEVVDVAGACIAAGAQQVTIHARLKEDRPRVPADWTSLESAAKQLSVPVMGNGDIWTEQDALRMVSLDCVVGVMVARGAIGNPWMLQRCVQALRGEPVDPPPSREERARVALEHLRENVAMKGERRGVLEMRKVVRHYIKGYLDSKRTWMRLIDEETISGSSKILENFSRGDDSLALLEPTPVHQRDV
ncbi:MAG: tRNA-dihydrouridine synthase family protein [bacterium]